MTNNKFGWIDFYMELAEKLEPYHNDRKTLLQKIQSVFEQTELKFPTLESDDTVKDIDPFTIFGMFNKQIKLENRVDIIKAFAKQFDIHSALPTDFDGIPLVNNQKANFFAFKAHRGEKDIDHLWDLYKSALAYSHDSSDINRAELIKCYNEVSQQYGIKWNITMGLYWILPYTFLNLDSRNRWFITNADNMPESFVAYVKPLFEDVVSGEQYLNIIERCKDALATGNYAYKNFPELSSAAWHVSEDVNRQRKQDQLALENNAMGDNDVNTIHYWMYAPGRNAEKWDECYSKGVMLLGWGEIGNLNTFTSNAEIKRKMKSTY